MTSKTASNFAIQRSGERAFIDHGWLQTYHSFSFADYVDPTNENWGALRVFNDDVIEAGQGFGAHPHNDMEILTYVLEGELEHKDSMGNVGVIEPGAVQYLSAGTGIVHSEYNHSKEHPVHLVQMWVLPGRTGEAPSYGQKDFALEERRNRWLTIVSGRKDVDAPIRITQDATFSVARLEDSIVVHEFEPQRFGFLFVADGAVEANGEALRAGDAVRLYDISRLDVKGRGEIVLWDVPPVSE